MDQQFVNKKPKRSSTGKTLSSLSLSTTSLSSSSSSSSSNLRQSQSFVCNNSKYNNSFSSSCSSRYANSNSSEKSNRRLSNSNQLTNNFSNNSSMNRKLNFNNKGSKNRQNFGEHNNNNSSFNFYYGNSNYSNDGVYENKKKTGQNTSKLTSSHFENDDTPQKKYKERKSNSNQQQQSFKDSGVQSNKRGSFGPQNGSLSHSSSSGTSSIGSTFNLNYKYQPPPFQPPAYHQNNKMNHQNRQMQLQQQSSSLQNIKVLLEKYDRKYNLISFILLRKKDEYLIDSKFYLNDQTLYQKIDNFVEKRQLKSLKNLFLNEKSPLVTSSTLAPVNFHLANFTNSYNCNIFVYTIRKCLEMLSHESIGFTNDLIRFLFNKNIRPFSFYLTDGDYPKRNLMHYAARYNCELLPCLLLESFKENNFVKTIKTEVLEKTMTTKEEEEKLSNLIEDDSCIITESPLIKKQRAEQEKSMSIIDNEILNFNNGHFVLAQLCMQTDFNDNTPIHLACQNNAFEFFKQVNPICIQHSQLLFNEDGLNPFLLASRHSSVKFLKHLIESIENSLEGVNNISEVKSLLIGVDKIYSKNCLHYACGRGCGKDALNVVKYLTNLAQRLDKEALQVDLNNNIAEALLPNSKPIFYQLIGSVSPLVGSVYHVAASNLTRLTTLWYLLNLYPINGIYLDNLDKTSILNKLDFRDFTAVDCLIDSVMNLREMAPPNYKYLAQFYAELLKHRNTEEKFEFDILLRRCLFKLLIDFKVKIYNLPRIRNQLQLIEFLKLIVFMSKFDGFDKERKINFSPRFDSNEFTNFEGFCVSFLSKFVFGDVDLMPLFVQSKESNQENEKKPKNQKSSSRTNSSLSSSSSPSLTTNKKYSDRIGAEELENLIEIFFQMDSLLDIVRFSNVYTLKFQIKLYSFQKIYSSILGNIISKNDSAYQRFNELKIKMEKSNPDKLNFNLKNLCRIKINTCLIKRTNQHYHQQQQQQYSQPNRLKLRFSALSKDYTYFKLPIVYSKMVNFLTFDLVQDLYGKKFDLNKFILGQR